MRVIFEIVINGVVEAVIGAEEAFKSFRLLRQLLIVLGLPGQLVHLLPVEPTNLLLLVLIPLVIHVLLSVEVGVDAPDEGIPAQAFLLERLQFFIKSLLQILDLDPRRCLHIDRLRAGVVEILLNVLLFEV